MIDFLIGSLQIDLEIKKRNKETNDSRPATPDLGADHPEGGRTVLL